MDHCVFEYRWYIIGFASVATTSIITNIIFVFKYICCKEPRSTINRKIPNDVEMETLVLTIKNRDLSKQNKESHVHKPSSLPHWAVEDYLKSKQTS